MIFKIAFRNILRHKRRTVLSSITIAAGILIFIFLNSVITGLDQSMIDNMVNLSSGAVKIYTQRYEQEKKSFPLNYGLDNYTPLVESLKKDSRVKGVTCRTQFLAQLSNYSETMPVMGTVIDETTDSTVFTLNRHIEGSFFGENSGQQIILGKKLAADLGVGVGDYITLYALTRYDSRNADEFKVVGLLNTTDPSLNFGAVYLTYTAAETFLDLEGLVTELNVSLVTRPNLKGFVDEIKDLQARVRKDNPGLAVNTFIELGAGILEMSRVRQVFGLVFLLVILLIAAVGIFNTVFMSVYERIREIGVLRAHGMHASEISRMFMLEGVITGFIGSILGLALGALLNIYLVTYGYPIDKIAGEAHTNELPFFGTAYGQWNPDAFIMMLVLGIFIATIAAIIPARKAARLEVTEAMRFV